MLDDGRSAEIAPSIIASWEVFCYTKKKIIRHFTNRKKNVLCMLYNFALFLQIIDNDEMQVNILNILLVRSSLCLTVLVHVSIVCLILTY
jgi:hypothetical protein